MKWIRRIGIVVGVIILAVAIGAGSVYAITGSRLSQKYVVPDEPPLAAATGDQVLIARGEHIATSIAKCADCHGADLGGGIVIDAMPIGHVEATNLTTGKGGVLASYSDATLERAIRHGIGIDGRNLVLMPSADYHNLSDADVEAVIAYIRSRPQVDREHQPSTVGPLLRTLWVAGKMVPIGAATIRHDAPHMKVTPVGNNVNAGRYIAVNGCAGCHGATYSGGPIPGTPPDWKPTANLTPTGIGHYSLADFTRVLREGLRPGGTVVDTLMPVKATKLMSDDEIESVYKFLKTLPPKAFGLR